jgi:CRP-like cAMP-binding protein
MNDVLAMYRHLPELRLAAGETLITELVQTSRLYILKQGGFEVLRNGIRVVQINEAGSFMGEISALLDSPPTASLVALCDSTVYVLEDAATAVHTQPELTLAIAQLLARRLRAVTTYIVDIKQQYAGSNTNLGLMDQVLGTLVVSGSGELRPGSERPDVPDY